MQDVHFYLDVMDKIHRKPKIDSLPRRQTQYNKASKNDQSKEVYINRRNPKINYFTKICKQSYNKTYALLEVECQYTILQSTPKSRQLAITD